VSTAISIGSKTGPVPGKVTASRPQPGDASAFARFIPVDGTAQTEQSGQPEKTVALTAAALPTAVTPDEKTADPLVADLASLLEKLDLLADRLKANKSLDSADLDDLEALLATLEAMLDQPATLSDTAALADLAKKLGLGAGENAAALSALDALSGLAAKLAAGLRDDAPDLAARLTGLTRALDAHAATAQSLLAAQKSDATVAIVQAESETSRNPAAAIASHADAAEEKPAQSAVAKPGAEPDSGRSLTKDAPSVPPSSALRQAQPQPDAEPAALPAAQNPAEAEALGLQPANAQSQSVAPTALVRPEAAAYQRPDAQINLPHVAVEIARQLQNGVSRFQISLNPAELGRIDVRMEMDGSGNVIARLAVERSETLDLLQRDQRALERALADAGLDTNKTDLEFSLQQHDRDGREPQDEAGWRTSHIATPATDSQRASEPLPAIRGYARLDAVNLWI